MIAAIVRRHGPAVEAIEVGEVPEPAEHPLTGERGVVIEVRNAGLSFPEMLLAQGWYQWAPSLPFVIGSEVAGVVKDAPQGSRFRPGDRVAACCRIGGVAETAVAAEHLTFPLPARMDFAAGAALVLNYHTAWHALVLRGGLRDGEAVLVLGAGGGLGTAALQVANGLGARTIAVVSDAGAGTILRLDEDWEEEARSVGVDLVFDPVGGGRFHKALRTLADGGRVVTVGFAAGEIPRVDVNRLLLRNTAVIGAGWGPYLQARPEEAARIGRGVDELVAAGSILPVVGQRFPLAAAAEALATIERRQARGKVVIDVGIGAVRQDDQLD
jgi:NADPH2:quinone reductase